jgi:hypothetical protein
VLFVASLVTAALRRTSSRHIFLSSQRPEFTVETVPGKGRLRLLGRGRLEVEIEPG